MWATSKRIGGVSEIAVLAPVKKGTVPEENRTYEQRLREAIDNIAGRHEQGLPIQLSRIPTIHFGRMIVIRPEQYLLYSDLPGIKYKSEIEYAAPADQGADAPALKVPLPIDDYVLDPAPPARAPLPRSPSVQIPTSLRTWLLTLVEFDGDIKVYMRDIAEFLGQDFDYIFENCENYPSTENFEEFWLWIRRYQINTDLFYAPYSNLSVARIRQLEDFKNRFDQFVAQVRSPTGPLVRSMDELFDEFLRETQQYASGFPSPSGIFVPLAQRSGG
jgi:hypothetical protein